MIRRPVRSSFLWGFAVLAAAWSALLSAALLESIRWNNDVTAAVLQAPGSHPELSLLRPLLTEVIVRHVLVWSAGVAALAITAVYVRRWIGERDAAVGALADSEGRFRRLVNQAGDGFELVDAGSQFVDVNEATCRMLGYTRQELLTMNVFDIDPLLTPARFRAEFETLGLQRALTFETQHRRKDGTQFPVEVTVSSVVLGGAKYAYSLVRDVTERHRADIALRQSQARLNAIVEGTSDAIYLKDARGRYLVFNAAAGRVVGKPPAEVLGHDDTFVFPPDEAGRVMANDRTVMVSGRSSTFEEQVTGFDGETHVFLATKGPLFDADGEVAGLFGIARDITERRRQEDEVAAARRELELFFGLVPDLVCIASTDGYFKKVGGAWEETLGYSPAELLAAPFECFIHPDDIEPTRREVLRQLGGERTIHFVNRYRTKGGDYRWLEWHASPAEGSSLYAAARDITERRLAEEAVRESEARYRSLFDHMLNGLAYCRVIFDGERPCDWVYLAVNDSFGTLMGLTDVVGRRVSEVIPGIMETNPELLATYARVAKTGIPERFEVFLPTLQMWRQVSAYQAGLDHFVAVFDVITERKRAEEELRLSRQRLALHVEQTPLAVIEFDLEGRVREWNPAAATIFGFPREEAVGQHWTFMVPAEVHASLEGVWEALVSRRGGTRSTNDNVTKSGQRIACEWFNTPLVGPDGRAIGVAALVMDVTERRRILREAQHLKDYLANVVDSMPSMLIGIDPDGRLTEWNRQAEIVTGVTATEAKGRPVTTVLQAFAEPIDRLLVTGQATGSASLERVPVDLDGERRLYDVMLYPLKSDASEGSVIRIEDVTERAHLQDLMIQTEKMMSVGGLAAGMAHEINNPLGIITQAAQNIERRAAVDLPANRDAAAEAGTTLEAVRQYFEAREIPAFIHDIQVASGRAAKIVTSMLEFSRRTEPGRTETDLADVMEQSLFLATNDFDLKKQFDFRRVEVVREYASDVPPVPVASVEIEQVFFNLLTNAAHAMTANPPDRPPRIVLRLRREHGYAVAQVEDNGPGVPSEIQRRVFEPFFTTKPPGGGTGLGLSVAYTIVAQRHLGSIEVAPSPSGGACFTVRLPLSAGPQPAQAGEGTGP